MNGATCVNRFGRYTCTCAMWYEGTNCERGGWSGLKSRHSPPLPPNAFLTAVIAGTGVPYL